MARSTLRKLRKSIWRLQPLVKLFLLRLLLQALEDPAIVDFILKLVNVCSLNESGLLLLHVAFRRFRHLFVGYDTIKLSCPQRALTCLPAIRSERFLAMAGVLIQAANAATEIARVDRLIAVIVAFL
jgi:hypothetical protein